ncbi:hypothetical protein Godav_025170 [Gossypium davidsonii]|uniref:Uncharacterized protein n=2 Tax=Gossypium TaxID=3633 RepID=A0A7J8T817_GOSDV|nr:hypothetical protein [Gossypium davidsonii]MBA0645541.1 hypothetical protein [Gossypium klotzschianum]
MLSEINKEGKVEHDEEKVLRLGSMILNSTKAKRDRKQKELMFMGINITDRLRNALIDTMASNLFISEKTMGKLGNTVSKTTKRIKTVNSKEVLSVVQLAKDVHCGKNIDSVDQSVTKSPLEMLKV